YSVGTVLYRALTGVLPFHGPPVVVLMDKQRREPPPPQQLVPELPADLCELCVDLLRRDPLQRPDGGEVLRRLGKSDGLPAPRRVLGSRTRAAPLIGRAEHAAALRDAFSTTRNGRAVTVLVRGRSGMGKSVLIEHVARELQRDSGAVVLAGRCYERESVSYKALVSLVDLLSRHLAQLGRHEAEALLPRDVLAVARLFPVLRRVDAVASAPRRAAAPDPHELKRRGLTALRELLARMADRRPLVLAIDDLQWGDLDSTSILVDLLHPPDPPSMLLLLSYRSEEAEASQAVRQLIEGCRAPGAGAVDVREIEVGALAPDEAQELALALLGREADGGEIAQARLAAAIARESGGDPFLIDQLVRFVDAGGRASVEDIRFEDVMRMRLDQLDAESRPPASTNRTS
ncbi:MAG TPA: AAA family ATPase, partial [Planctomycetota bacterium]|nr:AAA family ATPase [Planctomycetota bacterium]